MDDPRGEPPPAATPPPARGEPTAAPPPPPATSPSEIRGWYGIDWANSVYSTLGMSGFLPLLLQSSALSAAGFPARCGNVVTDAAVLASLFNGTAVPIAAHFLPDAGAPPPACGGGELLGCVAGGYCRGLPATPAECRLPDGLTPQRLAVGWGVDPTSYATLAIGFSTLAQAAVFVGLAGAADHGRARKTLVTAAGWAGGAATVACCAIGPGTWWLGAPLMLASSVCFGLTTIGSNAYLPVLVKALPEVAAAAAADAAAQLGGAPAAAPPGALSAGAYAVELAASERLSSRGFAWGYGAGVLGILACLPLLLTLPELAAYQAAMVLAGVWWAAFTLVPARYLRTRPGPPLPAGSSAVRASLAATAQTLRACAAGLPATGWFLVVWMVGSDGVFAIGLLGGLYANSHVAWPCGLPKALGLMLMFTLTPLAALLGNLGYSALVRRGGASPRGALLATMLASALVAAVGLAGALTGGVELLVLCVVYGLQIGAYQALSRALFATLVPRGAEASYFSLFEITNKGSSALGPLVIALIQQTTGDLRWGFAFILVSTLLPAWGLTRLDLQGGAAAARAWPAVGGGAAAGSGAPLAAAAAVAVVDDGRLADPGGGGLGGLARRGGQQEQRAWHQA